MAIPDCTADKLRKLIAGYLGVDASRITDEAHLSDDLGIEWLDQIELLLIIEDEFAGIQFSDPPAIELVGDLLRYIEMTSTQLGGSLSAKPFAPSRVQTEAEHCRTGGARRKPVRNAVASPRASSLLS
jgi:acyl carrier protein